MSDLKPPAPLTPEQFQELDDVLDWAIREKRKQIEAVHDADWVRPPEFNISERDEQFLADFTRDGIQELYDIQVALRNLAAWNRRSLPHTRRME